MSPPWKSQPPPNPGRHWSDPSRADELIAKGLETASFEERLELVRSTRRDSARVERERCARVVEDQEDTSWQFAQIERRIRSEIAAAIRALGDRE